MTAPIIAKILKLDLSLYRNYLGLTLKPDSQSNIIIITGANGSGKTNILEAISLLAPGRGIRGCKLDDIHSSLAPDFGYWQVDSEIAGFYGPANIKMRVEKKDDENVRSKRQITINGDALKSQAELSKVLAMSWLTPQMDQLFIGSVSLRRHFLDRIVQNFEQSHAKHLIAYEHAMRERLKLLKSKNFDQQWLDVLENNMHAASIPIIASRVRVVEYISEMMGALDPAFPQAKMTVTCESEFTPEILQKNRKLDGLTGRTNAGIHKTDLQVIYTSKNLAADKCSTGEQKSLLLSIFLAEIFAQIKWRGQTPILLLDEMLAHLDENRREILCQIIKDIKAQTWITGTESEIFAPIKGNSQFFLVENSAIRRHREEL